MNANLADLITINPDATRDELKSQVAAIVSARAHLDAAHKSIVHRLHLMYRHDAAVRAATRNRRS